MINFLDREVRTYLPPDNVTSPEYQQAIGSLRGFASSADTHLLSREGWVHATNQVGKNVARVLIAAGEVQEFEGESIDKLSKSLGKNRMRTHLVDKPINIAPHFLDYLKGREHTVYIYTDGEQVYMDGLIRANGKLIDVRYLVRVPINPDFSLEEAEKYADYRGCAIGWEECYFPLKGPFNNEAGYQYIKLLKQAVKELISVVPQASTKILPSGFYRD